jgi:hypothetical protein
MSLLTSTNAGSASVPYFIENTGGTGVGGADVPCVRGGDALGLVRIGNPLTGLVIGSTTTGTGRIRGGGPTSAGGSTLALGASTASFQNIVLTDSVTTINGALALPGAGEIFVGGDVNVGGDVVLTNGATGASISGYYSVSTAPLNCPDAADTAIPAVAGLTPGWHIVSCSTAPGGQTEQQVSDMVFRNAGGLYTFGGSLRTPAGAGSFGFKVTADRTGLVLSNSSGAAQNGVTVNFTKILNAA